MLEELGGLSTIRRLKRLCQLHNLSILVIIKPLVASERLSSLGDQLAFPNYVSASSNKFGSCGIMGLILIRYGKTISFFIFM